MKKGFEDSFTDIQSDYISLCLEYGGENIDKVFAYVYQTDTLRMFNAFFEKEGDIVAAGAIGTNEEADEFMSVGRDDIDKLRAVCEEYDQKCPNEIRMIYDVKTGKYDATLGYEDYSIKDKTTPMTEFLNWYRSEKKKTDC